MNTKLLELRRQLFKAKSKLEEDFRALDEVKVLLVKADERRLSEPQDARKWNRVLENLENSLDHTRARCAYSQAIVVQLAQECEAFERSLEGVVPPVAVPPLNTETLPVLEAEEWTATLETVGALNLEEASVLQSKIDAGEIHDPSLEAGLALANQMRHEPEAESRVPEVRRQLVLRAAIDKVGKQAFDDMTLDEIKLLMACHSLLTSRLEPTMRDQRLRRILDGAIKILQKRKDSMEGL
jgi:hypothetical protein